MREIKFRGKRIDNGEWVYGFLYISNISGCYILQCVSFAKKTKEGMNLGDKVVEFEVNPETVGQYTGLKDTNGTEIYEGDICNCREYECFGKIKWNKDNASFYFLVVMEGGGFEEERLYEYADELAVIGNIHDNPELLGGAE